MFLILIQSEGRVETAYVETRETFETELAAAQAELDAAMSEFEAYHYEQFGELYSLRQQVSEFNELLLGMDEDAGIIMVNLVANPNNINTRHVTIESPSHTARTDLSWDTLLRNQASFDISNILAEQLRNMENSVAFIVLRYDGTATFVDDLRLIQLAIHNQRLHNPNVFTITLDLR